MQRNTDFTDDSYVYLLDGGQTITSLKKICYPLSRHLLDLVLEKQLKQECEKQLELELPEFLCSRKIPLRSVWQHEARNFSLWLSENIDILSEFLGCRFSKVEREYPAGGLKADLVAEDISGKLTVIENQLEQSDHDHLGKLITYLAYTGAKTAVWIVADPKPEHQGVITWLNKNQLASFYLLKIEVMLFPQNCSINAVLTQVCGPNQ